MSSGEISLVPSGSLPQDSSPKGLNMRYQSWDVLVFPDQSKIPQQEFKTNCQAVQDPESLNLYPVTPLLPTVTCFIPSLDAGQSFRISIHSWEKPVAVRHSHGLEGISNSVSFEARVYIDGEKSGSILFDSDGPWPTVIQKGFEVDIHGETTSLKFPAFHEELLSQSYWSPVDDLGRVKVLIAEGFIRKNPSQSFERIRNIISFSFQHAPLDLLEKSSIAWPNPGMWQNVINSGPFYSRNNSRKLSKDGNKTHNQPRCHLSTKVGFFSNLSSIHPSKDPVYANHVNDPYGGSVNLFEDSTNPALKNWNRRSAGHNVSGISSLSSYTGTKYFSKNERTSSESACGNFTDDLTAAVSDNTSQSIPEISYSPPPLVLGAIPENNCLNIEEMDLLLGLDPCILDPSKAEVSDYLDQNSEIGMSFTDSNDLIQLESLLPQYLTNQCLKRSRSITPAVAEEKNFDNSSQGSMTQKLNA